MIRDPKDLQRYTASERANHWVVGISFILLALSGLAFFHPAFFPLTQLFGGPVWARILHPFIGVLLALSFAAMFRRFWQLVINATLTLWGLIYLTVLNASLEAFDCTLISSPGLPDYYKVSCCAQ